MFDAWRDLQGVVLDLDGTVYSDRAAMPGAAVAVQTLRSVGLRVRYATNATRQPRTALFDHLGQLGIDLEVRDVITAPRAAAAWLRANAVPSVALHLPETTDPEFDEFVIDAEHPAAVVVGDLGDGWMLDRLNLAFRQLVGGAELVAIQKNR